MHRFSNEWAPVTRMTRNGLERMLTCVFLLVALQKLGVVGTYSLVAILYFVCVLLTVASCPEHPGKNTHEPIGEWVDQSDSWSFISGISRRPMGVLVEGLLVLQPPKQQSRRQFFYDKLHSFVKNCNFMYPLPGSLPEKPCTKTYCVILILARNA